MSENLAQTPIPLVITAPLEVRTRQGRLLLRVGCDPDGAAVLTLHNDRGEATIRLSSEVYPHGGSVGVLDQDGRPSIDLRGGIECQGKTDGRTLHIRGEDGGVRLALNVGREDHGVLSLFSGPDDRWCELGAPDPTD